MKIGIVQPYLFPYIGYFQLINCVDLFVIYDDVQWIKKGWLNRNRIIVNGDVANFSFPVSLPSSRCMINEAVIPLEFEGARVKFIKKLENSYGRAPNFNVVFELVQRCLSYGVVGGGFSQLVQKSLNECCSYLGIDTKLSLSSELGNSDLKSQERIIDICKLLGAKHYINPIGGKALYSHDVFSKRDLRLSFLRSREIEYHQWADVFYPALSIIDVMMFNSVDEISSLLCQFDLED